MRAKIIMALGAASLLASCGDNSDPAQNAADVAEVEAINNAAQPISPERISYTDIETNNLFGAGCGFAPENSIAVLFLAQEERGFLKLDGDILALAPDKGSARLPVSSYAKYDGKDYVVELSLDATKAAQEGIELAKWPGRMTVHDANGRTVYESTGLVGCGS